MGPEIVIERIEIIQGGLLQIDFLNKETKGIFRCFADPDVFFGMIGKAMQGNVEKWNEEFIRMQENGWSHK